MDTDVQLTRFLKLQSEADGFESLSGAKVRSLKTSDNFVTIREEEELLAVGVVASHPQPDGSVHWSVETVVDRSMRFPGFEDASLEAALELVPPDAQLSVWSRRPSLDGALERGGFSVVRSLAYMSVQLPLEVSTNLPVQRFVSGDENRLLAINKATFGTHREAGGLDQRELGELMAESWFDADGLLFHRIEGVEAAFCWTKTHGSGIGEIYRIGVDPRFQGRGLGREIVIAGYHHLAANRLATEGVLWVDESNVAAVRLYEGVGMSVASRNREFSRSAR